jgi:hypothetical protein
MKIFETRNDLLDRLPKDLKIVELGVFKGEFSEEIYKRMNPKELYLVDIWKGEFGSGDKDGNNHTVVKDMKDVYLNLKNKYAHHDNIFIYRKNTIDFLNSVSDDYFDMIYVDADHSYEAVTKDMELSFLKLKNSGILAGHDYIKNTEIEAAVNNFCLKYNQTIISLTNDGCPTFLIQLKK